jgi:alpha-methylacyl-CoA racemase
MSTGPLDGVTVIEVGGIGPGPFAGMLLADFGADVIRVDRPGATPPLPIPAEEDLFNRGKKMIALDLKQPSAVDALLTLVERADALIEGFRPGVAERLGLGPDQCQARNPALVYGRMTGWGQDGPWAQMAGHDVNYISVTGALHAIGPADGPPQIPLNLLGDFGGGGTYLVMGVLAALVHARASGRGQVVDAAIVDGVSHLLSGTWSLLNSGLWADRRGRNVLDGAAPFYQIYETSDGRHMAVGPIEPDFWRELLERLGFDPSAMPDRSNPQDWPALMAAIAAVFASKTQDEWVKAFDGSDACVSPVVSLRDAAGHPQLRARGTLRLDGGRIEPAAAPRFSGSPSPQPAPPARCGAHTSEILSRAGMDVATLLASGAAVQS